MDIEYWSRLAKSAFFSGRTLKECVQVLHRDIVAVWNFHDPDEAGFCMPSSFPDSADCIAGIAARQFHWCLAPHGRSRRTTASFVSSVAYPRILAHMFMDVQTPDGCLAGVGSRESHHWISPRSCFGHFVFRRRCGNLASTASPCLISTDVSDHCRDDTLCAKFSETSP